MNAQATHFRGIPINANCAPLETEDELHQMLLLRVTGTVEMTEEVRGKVVYVLSINGVGKLNFSQPNEVSKVNAKGDLYHTDIDGHSFSDPPTNIFLLLKEWSNIGHTERTRIKGKLQVDKKFN